MKNEKKDSDLPCHTTDPRGRGKGWVEGGGLNWMKQVKISTSPRLRSNLFTLPLFEIDTVSSLWTGPILLAYL
jgi:hypothetical protein